MLLLLVSLTAAGVFAQESGRSIETDTLAYGITDTVPAVQPPVFKTEEDGEYSEDDDVDDTEYFIRKEFTEPIVDSIRLKKLSADMKAALHEDDAFWYANENFRRETDQELKGETPFFARDLVQAILWTIIIGGFIVFMFVYLKNSQVRLFRKSVAIDHDESSLDTSDIFSVNYESEIEKAAGSGNYRLAVRLMFLRLLRNMSGRKLIQYKQDSTNFDYLLQLRSGQYYQEFFRLTRNYEFTWYGQFDIDPGKYRIIKSEFDQFENKLAR
jgi:hypothetical protein